MIIGQSHPEGRMMSSPHHEWFPISLADTDPATCRLIDAVAVAGMLTSTSVAAWAAVAREIEAVEHQRKAAPVSR